MFLKHTFVVLADFMSLIKFGSKCDFGIETLWLGLLC